jgi:hypothetical protein
MIREFGTLDCRSRVKRLLIVIEDLVERLPLSVLTSQLRTPKLLRGWYREESTGRFAVKEPQSAFV